MNQTEQASILVVDDDDASRDLLASVLGASGYTVLPAVQIRLNMAESEMAVA